MIDSIQNGTGNSRWLKSNVPANITFAELIAQLRAGTLPIDLGAVNPAGWAVLGDPLNKDTLLSDPTAALYGLPNTAVPDEVFKQIKPLLDGKCRIEAGSYTGSYSGSGSKRKSLALAFPAKFIFIIGDGPFGLMSSTKGISLISMAMESVSCSVSGNTFSFTAEGTSSFSLNNIGNTYYFVAFG